MPPAARISDVHACPLSTPATPPVPHVGGPVVKGSHNVIVAGMPQARVGDTCVCAAGPPDAIAMGSKTVLVNGIPAARMGDPTAHGGSITMGAPNVLIGDVGIGKAVTGFGSTLLIPPICIDIARRMEEAEAARDNALLAGASYGDTDAPLPENTRRATRGDLVALGLHDGTHDMTRIADSDFRSEVFVRTDPATGQENYVIAFKGTTPSSGEDWRNNVRQGLGRDAAYYNQAMEIGATANSAAPGRVSFVGHSLGGDMASAASASTGAPAHTYNAAGLHPNTVRRYGPDAIANAPVEAYYVDGDILSVTQDSTALPTAAGRRHQLRPARRFAWSDAAGGAAGGLVGVLGGPLGSLAGGAAGFGTARGGRLHLMSSITDALDVAAAELQAEKEANGCP